MEVKEPNRVFSPMVSDTILLPLMREAGAIKSMNYERGLEPKQKKEKNLKLL